MPETEPLAWIRKLSKNATFDEAISWVKRMRRLLDRWDKLPDADIFFIPPQMKEELYAALDLAEYDIDRYRERGGI
jgi:hypothetical protein